MKRPRITFLLPAYNAEATLADTIDSVLAQSLTDFELLVIDDASTDATPIILGAVKDSRVRIIRNSENLELAKTLNHGFKLAIADYIARIDADDICLPHRAQTQAAYFDAHPGIAIVGSFVETFTHDVLERGTTIAYPTEPAAIAAGLVFRNTMAHPSVMLRKSAIVTANIQYDESVRRAQDYVLWSASVAAGLKLANIPEVLTRYRVHPGQATARESLTSLATAAAVRRGLIDRLELSHTAEELAIHSHLAMDDLQADTAFIHAAEKWLKKLLAANTKSKTFDQDAFAKTLTGRYIAIARLAKKINAPLAVEKSPFALFIHPGVL